MISVMAAYFTHWSMWNSRPCDCAGERATLAEIGTALRDQIAGQTTIVHPEIPEVHGLAYVMFRSREADGAMRHCTTLTPARADRSPCGTGTNSTVAVLHAKEEVKPGDQITTRSIIGGEFSAELTGEAQIGPTPEAVSGSADSAGSTACHRLAWTRQIPSPRLYPV